MSLPVIIGGGLAGLAAALSLAPRPVVILCRKIGSSQTSSEMAQGGIAAAVGRDDSLKLHEQDTLAAGAGLCDPRVVRAVIGAGPTAIEKLSIWGVQFDRAANGDLKTGLEGAHSRRRIVHARGDATGAAIMKALTARVKATPSITVIEGAEAQAIETDDRGVTGVTFVNHTDNSAHRIKTNHVVLASGSACALYRHTTVPHGSWGHGLLLAANAGARLRDMEFVQFHPTALDVGHDPMPLISEALRGEGARLFNELGTPFVGELNARDIVARAIWQELEMGRKVYLDAREVTNLRDRFPTIFDYCLKSGIDPRETMIPIRPVAHYHMGGVATDVDGKTTVKGLYACGEVACTGLHGANRLASNSLLEAVVMGSRVADALRPLVLQSASLTMDAAEGLPPIHEKIEDILRVRSLMISKVGLRRTHADLEKACVGLASLTGLTRHARIGLLIALAALRRKESRGAHDRKDYPETDKHQAKSCFISMANGHPVFEE